MRVEVVHYERKKSDGDYGNYGYSMTARLEQDEDPMLAAEALRAHVDRLIAGQIESTRAERRAEQEALHIDYQLEAKQAELEQMHQKWEKAKAFLEQHGVDTRRFHDTPF